MNVSAGRALRSRCWLLLIASGVLASFGGAAEALSEAAQPPPGQARPVVRVTAGEHGDFSRVVFAIGTVPNYRAERLPGGLRVRFPGARFEFDYAAADLQDRTRRVTAGRPEIGDNGASFYLSFNCDCLAKTFVYDGKLVIDVFDSGLRGSPDAPARAGQESADDASSRHLSGTSPAAVSQAGSASPELARGRPQGAPRPEFVRRVEQLGTIQPQGAPEFAADHLRSMLDWAIEQGHLTAARPADAGSAAAGPDAGSAKSAGPAHEARQGREDSAAAPPPAPAAAEKDRGGKCPDNSTLDAVARAGAGGFAEELKRRREGLSRALSGGNGLADAQLALAGFYLAHLMPQEALAILGSLDAAAHDEPDARWLTAAALLLSDRADQIAHADWRRSGCQGADIAIWRAAIVAALGGQIGDLLTNEQIFERLTVYPAALRIELGLQLALAAIDARAADGAERLLRIVQVAGPEAQALAQMHFLEGRLAAVRGDFAGARRQWQQAARLSGEGSVRASLALLRAAMKKGQPISDETLPLLDQPITLRVEIN